MQWWGENLYKGLPAPMRRLFKSSQPRLGLRFLNDDHLEVLWTQDGRQTSCGEYVLDRFDFNRVVKKHARRRKFLLELLLSPKQALRFRHVFPAAVQDNLRQVVAYQLDRLTPFTLDNVYYAAQVDKHDKVREEVEVDIHVAPCPVVNDLKQRLSAVGVGAVQLISNANGSTHLFRSGERQVVGKEGFSKVPLYVFLVALSLSLVIPLLYKERRLGQIEAALNTLRRDTAGQLEVRDQLMAAESALNFLQERRKTLPLMLDVLEQLSGGLPAHTWLERLALHGRQLELRGESSQALSLIDTLEGSPYFAQVRFKSPVTRSNNSGKDKFHLEAVVEGKL